MAKRSTAPTDDRPTHGHALRQAGLLVGVGLWLLVLASLLSYDPADPPSHAVGVTNDETSNWIGPLGAAIAHEALLMVGPGVWVAMLGVGAYLGLTLAGRPVNQRLLRGVGLLVMTATTSGLVAVATTRFVAGYDGPPEGPGGLLGVFIHEEMIRRFASAGTLLILGITFWIGALLAADQIVMALPRLVGEGVWRVTRTARHRWPNVQRIVAALPRFRVPSLAGIGDALRREVPQRENDLDGGRIVIPRKKRRPPVEEPDVATVVDDEYENEDEHEPTPPGRAASTARNPAAPVITASGPDPNPAEPDAPAAYVSSKNQFDPDELRAKMAQMPINFAPKQDNIQAPPREMDLTGYQFPGMDLLEEPEGDFTEAMADIVREQGESLEMAMREYKIEGEVVGIDSGPVITLFEVRLAPGTKVARITAVDSDLARALKAPNIRIVPNMAGKDTVGIEVPNVQKERVRLKELMSADRAKLEKMKLPMFLGKDASGNPLVQDLNAMPHMLIAGTTGSGKSVCMNSIIMSFLFTKRPDELKLVLVDPKMVEMSMFKSIPHLMCPVVTEMNKAAQILEWAVTKMDERYELLAEVGVRDIGSYNSLGWEEIKERLDVEDEMEAARIPKKLPYLVFVIDELADLMMTNKEVEGSIVRIAQKARAVGIHLILATQRPQANVVTGLIKSNMPSRVCMKVASGMDSRIVLDAKGGELLLGHGDMLFLSPRSSELVRAQGTLVDDSEIRKTVKFLKTVSQQAFEPQLVQIKSGGDADALDEERDPLFNDAVLVVLDTGRGSVSLLQRRLTIGYSRASRMIEQMEASGILGHHKTAQAREVLISPEEWEAMKEMLEADEAEADHPPNAPAPGVPASAGMDSAEDEAPLIDELDLDVTEDLSDEDDTPNNDEWEVADDEEEEDEANARHAAA